MRRRRFLAALPLAAGLAGCLTESGPTTATVDPASDDNAETSEDTTTAPSTESQAENPEPAETATVTTSDQQIRATLRAAYRHVINDDGIRVVPPNRDQFAFVRPPVIDEEPPPDAFTLELGDRQFSPRRIPSRYMSMTPGVDSVYFDENRGGLLMFDVPTVETQHAALVYDRTRCPIRPETVETFAKAPAFTLGSVNAPETVAPGEEFELGVTVTNEGDRAGIYLAGFRTGGFPMSLDFAVRPGETGSDSVTYKAPDREASMTFDFDYPGGDGNVRVYVVRKSTTPETATDA